MASTLDQVNQAARRAAEGSTGSPAVSPAVDAEEASAAEMQKMLEAMQHAMGGGGANMDSFVDTLMHGILSKDVLYEPLKVCPRHSYTAACRAFLHTRFGMFPSACVSGCIYQARSPCQGGRQCRYNAQPFPHSCSAPAQLYIYKRAAVSVYALSQCLRTVPVSAPGQSASLVSLCALAPGVCGAGPAAACRTSAVCSSCFQRCSGHVNSRFARQCSCAWLRRWRLQQGSL
jgi:hypothetical protein